MANSFPLSHRAAFQMLYSLTWLLATLLGSTALEKPFMWNAMRGKNVWSFFSAGRSWKRDLYSHLFQELTLSANGDVRHQWEEAIALEVRLWPAGELMSNEKPTRGQGWGSSYKSWWAESRWQTLDPAQKLVRQDHSLFSDSNKFCSCPAQP